MSILNIVIGNPLVPAEELIAFDRKDWESTEKEQTLFTDTRFLPAILKEAGVAPSVNEVRRNRPEYVRDLEKMDCFWVRWGKKRLYIIVGE